MKKGLPILFIAIVFFLKTTLSQSIYSTDGDSTFNYSTIHTVNITFTDPNFWDSLTTYHSTGECYMGSVNIDGTSLDSVCIALTGAGSYTSMPTVKKPIELQFDYYKSQKYDGLKTIALKNGYKDPTMMREKLMCDFLRSHSISSPRCTYANVYINGTLWGFYYMIEQVNKTFCTYNYNNNDGNLFKCDPNGNLKWKGATPALYYADYDLKTNNTLNDWSDLVHLIDMVNNTGANFHDSIETILNTDLFIKNWAADNMFVNLDSYFGSGKNYFLYHDTIINKFQTIAWDMNESFGNAQNSMTLALLKSLPLAYVNAPATNRPLVNNMLLNNAYKTSYLNNIYQWVNYDFSPTFFYPKIDSIANAIRSYVYADPNKQYTNANFDYNIDFDLGNIPGLKDFIQVRYTNLIQQLIALGYTDAGINSLTSSQYKISPNPATEFISISNLDLNKTYSINLYDLSGRLIVSVFAVHQQNFKIERKNIINGVYILEVNDNVTPTQRVKVVLN